MSDFDLRKFLAEQKAPKEEAVEEVKHEGEMEEAHGHDKEMEETYHEGEDSMEEGEVDESVIAGVAALIGGSIAAGKVLDYIADKYPEATKKFIKASDAAMRGSGKSGMMEAEEEANEEELKENAFKSSIKDILNS